MTIRVAWELHQAGVRLSPQVLAGARDHVLMSLPEQVGREQAEELASYFTHEFVDRVRRGRYRRRPFERPAVDVRPSWRPRLLQVLDPVGQVVLRLVYGDGLSLDAVERLTRVDRVVLRGACHGVRSAMLLILREDGLTEGVQPEQLDRLLARVARSPAASCGGGEEIAMPWGREHAEECPRCARGFRLVRAGLLSPSDLVPPVSPVRPREMASVLVLHLHPEARHHRKLLCEQFEGACLRADDDAVLVDLDRIDDHVGILHLLAEQGTPRREHIRGAQVRGAGRWTRAGLLGPVASAAVELTRARPWAEVDGAGRLPDPLPEPPSATRWWSAALLVTLLAIVVGLNTFTEPPPQPTFTVSVQRLFDRDGGGVLRMDVDDAAYLAVFAQTGEGLELVHSSAAPADKGALATGEGDFILRGVDGNALVVASPEPLAETGTLLAAAALAPNPLEELAERVLAVQPHADARLAWAPPPAPEVASGILAP